MTDTTLVPQVQATAKPAGYFRASLSMGRTWLGLLLVTLIVGVAMLGPYFAPFSGGEAVGGGKPTQRHVEGSLFGSDKLGQDVWSRFLLGGREILIMAVSHYRLRGRRIVEDVTVFDELAILRQIAGGLGA